MNIRPLYDRIVVKRIETQDEKTASGLIIPDSAKEKPQEGEVVAQSARASASKTGKLFRWTCRSATASCSASTPAARSSSMAKNT